MDTNTRLETRREYQRRYRALQAEIYKNAFTLTTAEKIKMGLIEKPEPLRGTIHIVIPEHYGSKGVMWTSRFVTEAQLDSYLAQYPGMQILDERYKVRKKEPEPDAEDDDDDER